MPVVLVYLLLLAVAFFFLIVRPQRRQLAARQALIATIEVGDEIITAGGIYGRVRSMGETTLEVEVADGIVLTVAREAIARRREDEPTPTGEQAGADPGGQQTLADDEPDGSSDAVED
jgi:preprotein translocase subunit YajC